MNMEYVEIVEKDENGNIQGGIDFWHVPGADTYLYQQWEHTASGNSFGQKGEFSQVLPDPVVKSTEEELTDLQYTIKHCWLEQTGMVWSKRDDDYR